MKINTLILILLITVINSVQSANNLTIQQRLANLEKQVKQPQDNRTNVADLVFQIQTMQQQMAELKGVIEEQAYQIDNLKEKQKLLYVDVDTRLADLESNNNLKTSDINTPDLNNQTSTNQNTISEQPLTVEVDEGYNDNVSISSVTEPVISSDQDDYDIAFAHLRAGRFLESARGFESFIQKYPNNELTDNAYYWLGESYYVKRQYPQALAAFKALTEKFPSSDKASDSLLKIGYSYFEMDDFIKAEENLQKVIDSYPNSSLARLAKNRLRQLQRDH